MTGNMNGRPPETLPAPEPSPYLIHFHNALAHPLGVWLRCTNPHAVRTYLYAARIAAQDPRLDAVVLRLDPSRPDMLWMVNIPPPAPSAIDAGIEALFPDDL